MKFWNFSRTQIWRRRLFIAIRWRKLDQISWAASIPVWHNHIKNHIKNSDWYLYAALSCDHAMPVQILLQQSLVSQCVTSSFKVLKDLIWWFDDLIWWFKIIFCDLIWFEIIFKICDLICNFGFFVPPKIKSLDIGLWTEWNRFYGYQSWTRDYFLRVMFLLCRSWVVEWLFCVAGGIENKFLIF
jgi:hypothetical protein